MKTVFSKFFLLAVIFCFALLLNEATAQLKKGSLGIGASFTNGNVMATGYWVMSSRLEVGAGLQYVSETMDSDVKADEYDNTTLRLQVMGKFFLKKGKDVSPYVGGELGLTVFPGIENDNYDESDFEVNFAALFGGQVFIAKQFALFGQVGFGYITRRTSRVYNKDDFGTGRDDEVSTKIRFSLGGSAVGAIFYF